MMSIKIWTAYKIPEYKFDEFTDDFDQFSCNCAKNFIRKLVNSKKTESDLFDVFLELEDLILASAKTYSNPFSVEYGFEFIKDGDFYFIIPYPLNFPLTKWESFDFHYQDQVDKDDNISTEEWDYRRKEWDRILIKNPKPRIHLHQSVTAIGLSPSSRISSLMQELYIEIQKGA